MELECQYVISKQAEIVEFVMIVLVSRDQKSTNKNETPEKYKDLRFIYISYILLFKFKITFLGVNFICFFKLLLSVEFEYE